MGVVSLYQEYEAILPYMIYLLIFNVHALLREVIGR